VLQSGAKFCQGILRCKAILRQLQITTSGNSIKTKRTKNTEQNIVLDVRCWET